MQNPTFLFLALLTAANVAAQQPPRTDAKDQRTQAIVLSVSGMTWAAGCPPAVRKALLSLPWVREAKVDYSSGTATIVVERSAFDAENLVAALERAGFGGAVRAEDKKQADQNPEVTFHVIGMMKTKSGATWMGWPDKVTEALEGSHSTSKIAWDYDKDMVTIAYDPKATSSDKLAAVIKGLGYEVEQVERPSAKSEGATIAAPKESPIPKDAPEFFVDAMTRASTQRRPVLIDFWAEWCAPCKALKDNTMADPGVAKSLESIEVIFVDVDQHPQLAKAYGVTSIPDVFFVNLEGVIVDRLRQYEPPDAFRKRLEKLVRQSPTDRTK